VGPGDGLWGLNFQKSFTVNVQVGAYFAYQKVKIVFMLTKMINKMLIASLNFASKNRPTKNKDLSKSEKGRKNRFRRL